MWKLNRINSVDPKSLNEEIAVVLLHFAYGSIILLKNCSIWSISSISYELSNCIDKKFSCLLIQITFNTNVMLPSVSITLGIHSILTLTGLWISKNLVFFNCFSLNSFMFLSATLIVFIAVLFLRRVETTMFSLPAGIFTIFVI